MEATGGNRAVVVVVGKDRIGIVAGLSEVLASCSVNILDIQQTLFQDLFVMSMLVDLAKASVPLPTVRERLQERGDSLGVKVTVQHENVFRYMHRV